MQEDLLINKLFTFVYYLQILPCSRYVRVTLKSCALSQAQFDSCTSLRYMVHF